MGAFIIAGLVLGLSFLSFLAQLFASGMSDNPSTAEEMASNAVWSLAGGAILAVWIAASHWLPHIGWRHELAPRAHRDCCGGDGDVGVRIYAELNFPRWTWLRPHLPRLKPASGKPEAGYFYLVSQTVIVLSADSASSRVV